MLEEEDMALPRELSLGALCDNAVSRLNIAPPRALADALHLIPVDDGDVVLAVDAVGTHQAARRQLLDHGTHRVAINAISGEDLHADGARAQRLDAKIVGEGPQAKKQETGHRCAVDDSLPGPEVGGDRAVAGHHAGSNRKSGDGVTSQSAFSYFRPYECRPSRSGR